MAIILIVDDDLPVLGLAAAILRNAGHSVDDAGNGADALKLITTLHPDVVFLDIQMPDINGVGVVDLLQTGRPLVVFVTAHDQYAARAAELNAVDYVLKPVSVQRLRQTVDLVRKRLAQAAV